MPAVGEMISLSRVIKSHFTKADREEQKVIRLQTLSLLQGNDDKGFITEYDRTHQDAQVIIEEAKQNAEKINLDAKEQFDQIQQQIKDEKQAWVQEKQKLFAAAQQDGYEAGFNNGLQVGSEQYKQAIQEANHIISKAKEEYAEHIQSSEETILKLGMKVAEQILQIQLSENDDRFLELVKKAVREVREYSNIQIHVHPNYYEVVVKQKAELISLFNKEIDIYICPNEELEETSCIIESSFGRIDASVDSQLTVIREKLLEFLREE